MPSTGILAARTVHSVAIAPLDLSAAALTRLRWTVHLGFPAVAAALGVIAWFLRRK